MQDDGADQDPKKTLEGAHTPGEIEPDEARLRGDCVSWIRPRSNQDWTVLVQIRLDFSEGYTRADADFNLPGVAN